MRTEYRDRGIVHVALNPEGELTHSSAPHALIIVDFDGEENIVGVTFAGPLARIAVDDGVRTAVKAATSEEILTDVIVHNGGEVYDQELLDALDRALQKSSDRLVSA